MKIGNGRSLVDTGVSMVAAREVVSDEDPSGLTAEANIILLAVVVR